MEAAESWTQGNLRVAIYPDQDTPDPRKERSNAAVLVCWHKRYNLGDRQPTERERAALRRGGFPLLTRYLRRVEGAIVVLPLGLLDHSGITMYIGGGPHWSDTAGWDSGTVGFAYITREVADKEGIPEPEQYVRGEVAEYDKYLTGDVWGYTVKAEDDDGEVLDSCWGYYGFDYACQEARSMAEFLASEGAPSKRRVPEFTPAAFTPTKWSTAADKAKFANQYVRFVEGGFHVGDFPKWFYTRLSMCFGHIAHYDQGGFYGTWFTSKARQSDFLLNTLEYPCYGDPGYTYSDVEHELQDWVRESGILQQLEREIAENTEAAERQQLAVLRAKYG